MTNKASLIKAIIHNDTAAIKAIQMQQAPTSFVSFSATETGFLSDADGKTYSLEQVERMSLENNMIAFVPADGLTGEQLEKYQNFNQ